MKLDTRWATFDVDGETARGYAARPAVLGPLPGVLVIQEAFGVDPFVRDVTERFAAAGYAAFAPDLFSRGGTPAPLAEARVEAAKRFLDSVPQAAWFDASQRGPALAALPAGERAALEESLAMLLPASRPWDAYVATLRAARAWLAAGDARARPVGCVGFCMGGALSLRLACADDAVAAAVVFYGAAPPDEALDGLRAPVLGLYAEHDPRITGAVPALAESLRARGRHFEHRVYPGAAHAFFNDTRGNYRVDAARDAWARTLAFLAQHLG